MNAERFGDKGRETAEQEAISEACEARDETEEVWVLDIESENLGQKKD
jgi:hypothetical protein